jgi:hypothetical protein
MVVLKMSSPETSSASATASIFFFTRSIFLPVLRFFLARASATFLIGRRSISFCSSRNRFASSCGVGWRHTHVVLSRRGSARTVPLPRPGFNTHQPRVRAQPAAGAVEARAGPTLLMGSTAA